MTRLTFPLLLIFTKVRIIFGHPIHTNFFLYFHFYCNPEFTFLPHKLFNATFISAFLSV